MSDALFASTPAPPYFAVIFTSRHTGSKADEYQATGQRMIELAGHVDGFLGLETTRGENGLGITVSYWRDEDSIQAWYANLEHKSAQHRGREQWYRDYRVRVARVERDYGYLSDRAAKKD